MNSTRKSYHLWTLEYASEEMLKFPRSERFLKWVIRSIFTHWKPLQVSIALLDLHKRSFPIKFSLGKCRFPPRFVTLNESNALLHAWAGSASARQLHCKSLHLRNGAGQEHSQIRESVVEDLARHKTQICIKIQTAAGLMGYLLVGPREDDSNYTAPDLAYFETLANDIAIEIELEKYYQSSNVDPLTQLYNRYALKEKFEAILHNAREKQRMIAVAMADLDNFKTINDRYGHLTGDEVLRITGGIIRKNIRQPDLAFRYGGEEFLILFPLDSRSRPAHKIEAHEFRASIFQVVERLRKQIASRLVVCTLGSFNISASIGLSFYDGLGPKTAEKLIDEADQGVYASKKAGKNTVTIYQAPIEFRAKEPFAPPLKQEDCSSTLSNLNLAVGNKGRYLERF